VDKLAIGPFDGTLNHDYYRLYEKNRCLKKSGFSLLKKPRNIPDRRKNLTGYGLARREWLNQDDVMLAI
jgi:hypothetical protein